MSAALGRLRGSLGSIALSSTMLLPATVVPGLAAFAGMVVLSHVSGLRTVGLMSLARVAGSVGASMIAEAPSLGVQRSLAAQGADRAAAYRWALVRRSLAFVPIGVAAGAAIALWRPSVGIPFALGSLLMVPEGLFTFESAVFRYHGRFVMASAYASTRSVAAWAAVVAVAAVTGSFLLIGLAYLGALLVVGASFVLPRPIPVDEWTRRELRESWRSLASYNLASNALNNGDQYLLALIAGPATVGLYSLGYMIGGGVVALVAEPVTGVIGPRIIRSWGSGGDGRERAYSMARSWALAIGVLGLTMAAGVWLAGYLGWLDFVSTNPDLRWIAAVVAAAIGFHIAASVSFQTILYLQRQTGLLSRSAWVALIVSVPAVVGLTLAFGVIGTAVATFVSYGVMALFQVVAAARYRDREGTGGAGPAPGG